MRSLKNPRLFLEEVVVELVVLAVLPGPHVVVVVTVTVFL